MAKEYAAIILAAGLSNQMKGFKPLLTAGGMTISDRVIATFLSNNVEVLLVTGWKSEELLAGIKHQKITVVKNPDYERGMFSSIQAGISRLLTSHRAFFVMPVDIPLVRPETIRRLLESAEEFPDKILYPVFSHTRGHPPLIPSSLIPDIMAWSKACGLKDILNLRQ